MTETTSTVLLYYFFVDIDEPEELATQQRYLCQKFGLKGRILVAKEGINGTLAGTKQGTDAYQEAMRKDPRFENMEFKISSHAGNPFPRLMVKARKEIVTLGVEAPLDVDAQGGQHLSPAEWKRMIQEEDDVVLFDTRNRYESDIGRFKGALLPNTEHFRDLPDLLEKYEAYKDKKFLMYCTGGIRCEKATVLFRQAGFKHVYQLHGGIVNYWKEEGDDLWEGDCFVFDERMYLSPPNDDRDPDGVGRCVYSGRATRNFINCLHDPCHRLFLIDPEVLAEDEQHKLCPECRAKGLNLETAIYQGSPAMPKRTTPKNRRNRRNRKRITTPANSV